MVNLIVIVFLFLTFNVFAENKPFYSDKNRGWYAYEVPSDNDTVQDEENLVMSKPNIPWETLDIMEPKQFNKLLEEVKDYALSYRTMENYGNYARMRNVAVARAEEFASLSTLWAQLNPELTGESSYPVNVFGSKVWKEIRSQSISETLSSERKNYGIIYFFSDNCQYCIKQSPVIQYFIDEYGWTVEAINVSQNDNMALRFNIVNVPSIILVERGTGIWMLVSGGIIDFQELSNRLYKSIRYLKGGANETDYDNSNYSAFSTANTGKLAN